jgi:hypothetical protein
MADIDVVQKPSGQNTWIWAIVAVLAVGALIAWLGVQSSRTTTAVVVQEGNEAAVDPDAPAGTPTERVELAVLGDNPAAYSGQEVEVEAPVAATLGPRAFWADIPGANPFLVVLTPAVGVTAPQPGQTLRLFGTVVEVTDDQVDAWIAEGAVNEGSRSEAVFATHALLADELAR